MEKKFNVIISKYVNLSRKPEIMIIRPIFLK